jgi:hypothetical protein
VDRSGSASAIVDLDECDESIGEADRDLVASW